MAQFHGKLPKYKHPQSKSFSDVQSAVKHQLTITKLQYFSCASSLVQPYLTAYQNVKPNMPLMHGNLQNSLKVCSNSL